MLNKELAEKHTWLVIISIIALIALWPSQVHAWPTTSQWIPIYKSSSLLQDPGGDSNGARNVVSDASNAAAFVFSDGTYLFFRLRLDKDPTGQGGQGALQAFGWGVELDTNRNAADYEWLIMIDGIAQTEVITLSQNTIQGTLGDPSDKPESVKASISLAGNYQISMANTAINGDTDYFLDWRFPYATFKQASGLTDTSPVRLFFGSSSSGNNLTSNGADFVGGSDLYSGFSDTITLLGTTPTTGTVRFVSNLAGSGDVTQIFAGDTLYIRIDDGDVNNDNATLQTLPVTLKATSGDTLVTTLTETQINSGIFTGSVPTQSGTAVVGDTLLQVIPGATVSVEYIDGLDASFQAKQIRADSVNVRLLLPTISLVKSADQQSVQPGSEVIYTVHYHNAGEGVASNLIISDSIPLFSTYVSGSLKIGNATSTYLTATPLTDANDSDAGQFSGNGVIFTINSVAGDDGVANAGSDEGKVYFKVRIN